MSTDQHDPFSILGPQLSDGHSVIRLYRPDAKQLFVHTCSGKKPMKAEGRSGLFQWRGSKDELPKHPNITQLNHDGSEFSFIDAYSFPPELSNDCFKEFSQGSCWQAHKLLGAHPQQRDDVAGVRFSLWAPNAKRVSIIADFNYWDGRTCPMQNLGDSGVWELFIPGVNAGCCYKYEIKNRDTDKLFLKADPYGQRFELRPQTASVVVAESSHRWSDQQWIQTRSTRDWLHAPVSIYEVHLGSWRHTNGNFPNYRSLAPELVQYVKKLGFTHLQLMPITEHPFDGSWGYQVTGYFSPTSRYGDADDLRYFVDYCHQHGIAVLLDWVPGHFPKDEHALGCFDGTSLYEHEDPAQAEQKDWGTLVFNYGRTEVKNFLLSSAYYWLSEFHFDGLRIDAVASMLYLDYSREAGDWTPNQYGGNENLEAIAFLQETNTILHEHFPGALIIAEESTAWPMVSRPVYLGGLGFSMKWNMGWMNDTLSYMALDPVYRQYNQEKLTFGLLYAFTENFILPLSHDEVVHEKKSLLAKMPGDNWQQFANLRLLYVYMFTHPGNKLLFMGNEFAQQLEWDHDRELSWELLQHQDHLGMQRLITDLNQLYKNLPTLHKYDFEQRGFQWLDCNDSAQSVLSYLRRADDDMMIIVLNFTPVPRRNYRIAVPLPGLYRVILNSDSSAYAGSNYQDTTKANDNEVYAEHKAYLDQAYSLTLTLPPLAGILLQLVESQTDSKGQTETIGSG